MVMSCSLFKANSSIKTVSFFWELVPVPKDYILTGIRLFREALREATERHRAQQENEQTRILQAQQAIIPQAMEARDRAVEANIGGERLYDTDAFPRSADGLYQYMHDA